MQYRILVPGILVTGMAVGALSQAAPEGWQVVSDVRKSCQIAVPAEWTVKLSSGFAPEKKATATVHGMRAGQSWDEAKGMLKQTMKPIKIVQDDAKRLWYTMDPGTVAGDGKSGWYVAINTTPVCTASFTFDPGSDEETLKQIAESLVVAK